MKNKSLTLLVLAFSNLIGCASLMGTQSLKVLPDQGPVHLALKPTVGEGDVSDYRSITVTKSKPAGLAAEETTDEFNFTIETKVTHVDTVNNLATYNVSTLKKDGQGDLADFAMPETGESLDLVMTHDGQVVKAGDYPPGTLYYVSPTSLPKEDVKVGDTWLMQAEWVSLKSGVPMHLEVVSILKSIRDCGPMGRCAEIELSGDESIIGAPTNPISSKVTAPPVAKNQKKGKAVDPYATEQIRSRFKSELKGRMLFSIEKGAVIYSYMKTDEHLNGEQDNLDVISCMTSAIVKPEALRMPVKTPDKCDPTQMPNF